MNADFWNDRYGTDKLVYGDAPNDFLVQMSERLPSRGKALGIGAGEGQKRSGVSGN